MRILRVLFVLLLLSGAAYAAEQKESAAAAEQLLDKGEYGKAEAMLRRLIQAEPKKAEYHQLLGDVHKRQGRLNDALDEYEKARGLGAENAEIYKSIGTVNKWLGNRSRAEQAYNKALKINPNDREARDDLKSLKQSRGLKVSMMAGGWEPDSTKSKVEVMGNYGGVEKMDIFGGYSTSDNVTYKRKKIYGGAYFFYEKGSYLKAAAYHKDYDYPTGVTAAQPDSNAYDKVPGLELEVSHWLTPRHRGTLAYEYSRPNFLYDSGSKANNHKVSAELYYLTDIDWLRVKVMYAVLKDPNPDTTLIAGRTCLAYTGTPPVCSSTATATEIHYQTQSLLGAGVEVAKDRWSGELKYLPNRDLDSSYSSSILAAVGYKFSDRFDGRFDYLYDKYSSKSAYTGQTAKIYLFSGFYKLDAVTDLGLGVKFLDQPAGNDVSGFVTLSYKTAL